MNKSTVKHTPILLDLDVPNSNGHIYPRLAVEQAIDKCEYRCVGQIGMPEWIDLSPSANELSHVVTNLRINEQNQLVGDIELLDTESGNMLAELYRIGFVPEFATAGTCSIERDQDGFKVIQNDYKMVSINVVPKRAFKINSEEC